jgi:hypothetical protein
MIDEADVRQEKRWFYEQCARTVISNLQKKNMEGQYVSDCQEALSAILEMIPSGAIVARGDGVTLAQIGILSELKKRNQNRLVDPFEPCTDDLYLTNVERKGREALSSDIFLTGTNAITLDGKLVNIDGMGNRVSAMIFGPKKVIIVAGVNKIVKDMNEALERVQKIAAPINAKRHYSKHHRKELGDLPCVRTGRCVDCNHEFRICRYTVIIEGAMARERGRINVVLVGEELGI